MRRARVSPVLQVGDVQKTVEFYRHLGFRTGTAHVGERAFACVEIPDARLLVEPRPAGAIPARATFLVAVPDPARLRQAAERLGAVVGQDAGVLRIEDPDTNVMLVAKERGRARPRPRRAVKRKRRRR